MLNIKKLHLENFRCFTSLDVSFEQDLTVIFAENGGGKSSLLTALAMSLSLLQPRQNKELKLDGVRDARSIRGADGRREPAGPCRITCTAAIGDRLNVEWSFEASATSSSRKSRLADVTEAIEAMRRPGERWPLLGYYGTNRLTDERKVRGKVHEFQDRWDGYAGCLDPSTKGGPLLEFLQLEAFGDLTRHRKGEPERRYDMAVFDAMKRATPRVADIHYEPVLASPVVRFDDGSEATWAELSDGFHVYMGLIGDIARRAVILNGQDGRDAPLLVEGVVLIDEVDLHLHPRWQREVLHGLRKAFPKLQLVVTTHSPQVLSSVRNEQARMLVDFALRPGLRLEGRDSNAILRDFMDTPERDGKGEAALLELYAAIDGRRFDEAKLLVEKLRAKWGGNDPEFIRVQELLAEEV